jgi:hypothetical protein
MSLCYFCSHAQYNFSNLNLPRVNLAEKDTIVSAFLDLSTE